MSNQKTVEQVLITGGTGLLGVAIQQAAPEDVQIFTIYHPERSLPIPLPFPIRAADVSDRRHMQSIFEWSKPDVVIHTAAIGSVDYAEKNQEETKKINVGGTEVVAALCEQYKSRLVYISSNAVFDGKNPFYSETDHVNPLNYYGKLKVEAERVVRDSNTSWAILRAILMYGLPYPGERVNPVVWWTDSLSNDKPVKVVDNVYSKPLPAQSCAEAVWAIIQKNRTGVYHAAGRDHVSLYQFALMTADIFGLDASLITPVPDSYFPNIALRPQDTSFNTAKMESELNVKPVGIRAGLLQMKSTGSVEALIQNTHY
jgi:dTDP-4-dehydrorhamnose reductase